MKKWVWPGFVAMCFWAGSVNHSYAQDICHYDDNPAEQLKKKEVDDIIAVLGLVQSTGEVAGKFGLRSAGCLMNLPGRMECSVAAVKGAWEGIKGTVEFAYKAGKFGVVEGTRAALSSNRAGRAFLRFTGRRTSQEKLFEVQGKIAQFAVRYGPYAADIAKVAQAMSKDKVFAREVIREAIKFLAGAMEAAGVSLENVPCQELTKTLCAFLGEFGFPALTAIVGLAAGGAGASVGGGKLAALLGKGALKGLSKFGPKMQTMIRKLIEALQRMKGVKHSSKSKALTAQQIRNATKSKPEWSVGVRDLAKSYGLDDLTDKELAILWDIHKNGKLGQKTIDRATVERELGRLLDGVSDPNRRDALRRLYNQANREGYLGEYDGFVPASVRFSNRTPEADLPDRVRRGDLSNTSQADFGQTPDASKNKIRKTAGDRADVDDLKDLKNDIGAERGTSHKALLDAEYLEKYIKTPDSARIKPNGEAPEGWLGSNVSVEWGNGKGGWNFIPDVREGRMYVELPTTNDRIYRFHMDITPGNEADVNRILGYLQGTNDYNDADLLFSVRNLVREAAEEGGALRRIDDELVRQEGLVDELIGIARESGNLGQRADDAQAVLDRL